MAIKTFDLVNYNAGWNDLVNNFTNVGPGSFLEPASNFQNNIAEWTTTLGGVEHWVKVKIVHRNAANSLGCALRCKGDDTYDCYFPAIDDDTIYLYKYTGSQATVASEGGHTFSTATDYWVGGQVTDPDGSTVRVEIRVHTTEALPNEPTGIVFTVDDVAGSRITTGNYGGIYGRNNSGTEGEIYEGKGDAGSFPAPPAGGFVPYPNPRYALDGGMQNVNGGI